jgi:hypothetical protein
MMDNARSFEAEDIIIVNAKDEVRDKVEACIKSCSGIKKYIIRG